MVKWTVVRKMKKTLKWRLNFKDISRTFWPSMNVSHFIKKGRKPPQNPKEAAV